tara:strand:- start:1008 stop:1226 length:219 start_codon:yes stop_codon:yes gene_type:complete
MSSQTHSQGSPSEEIEWDLEELKKAIIDSADDYNKLLDKAGQEELPSGTAEAMWEMERQMWAQRQGTDEHSF